jgi:hypothetical protein
VFIFNEEIMKTLRLAYQIMFRRSMKKMRTFARWQGPLQIIVLYVPLNLRYFGKRGTPLRKTHKGARKFLVHFFNCDETNVEIKYYLVRSSFFCFVWGDILLLLGAILFYVPCSCLPPK